MCSDSLHPNLPTGEDCVTKIYHTTDLGLIMFDWTQRFVCESAKAKYGEQ